MKTNIFILSVLAMISLAGCVKQNDCTKGVVGTFQYLNEPIYLRPYCQFKEEKVTALFMVGDINTANYVEYYLSGNIPKEYRSIDLMTVRVCFHDIHEGEILQQSTCPAVYELTCIEKVDGL